MVWVHSMRKQNDYVNDFTFARVFNEYSSEQPHQKGK